MGKYKAVIFDLDGVITDTAEFHYLAWKNLAKSLGIEIDRAFNETLKGVSRIDSLKEILKLGNILGNYTEAEIDTLANKKNEEYVELIKKITPSDILPGIIEFLEKLKKEGIKIAMASASKNAFMVADLLQVSHYFDHIVDASKVANSKPDPEVFLKAASAVGVSPVECMGVEDARAGVVAIKAAGMYAVGIGEQDILDNADIVLSDTTKLNELAI